MVFSAIISSMKKLLIILLLVMGMLVTGCQKKEVTAGENEFIVIVELAAEDREICVLNCDYFLEKDLKGGRSVCNANQKTPLKGELYFNFEPADFPAGADISTFSAFYLAEYDFSHVGEVANYADADLIANEIVLNAKWGQVYRVRITGSREKGYAAEIVK